MTQVGITAQGIAIDGQYTMNVGDRLQVSAMVTMSDGARDDRTASATWSSDNTAVVTVAGGLITAVKAGQAMVTARYDSVLARLSVTVRGGGDGGPGGGGGGDRTITRLEVESAPTVAVGRGAPLAAVAHFSDGSRETVTTRANWSVEPTSTASISDGQLHGIRPGAVAVTAVYEGMSATANTQISATTVSVVSVAVSGSLAVAAGGTTQLVAVATLSDGSRQTTTTLAQWTSSQTETATVTDGLVRGVAAGSAVITARVDGVSGQATVQVSGASSGGVTSLSLGGNTALQAGSTTQLTATAHLAGGSQQNVTGAATWSSSNTAVATVADGLVTGVSAGSATISVQYQGASQQATVQVSAGPGGGGGGGTPTLTGLTVQGGSSVVVGQTVQLTATALYSNGSQQVVTAAAAWSSSAPATASVSGGLVTGASAGAATITATYQGQTGTAQVAVTTAPVTVTGVNITGTLSLPAGGTSQLTVRATLSNGTTVDVTAQATYSSSLPLLASVSASGQVTGLLAGLAQITATYQGVSAQVQVQITVALPTVTGVTINGASSVKLLQLLNLTAVATLSDGSQQTVTESCTWSSSNLGILELLGNGVLRGLLIGNVTVTVNYQGKSAQKTVQVTLL